MPHQTRDVRRFAQRWISYNIEVGKTCQPEGLSDPVAPGLLYIAEQLRGPCQTKTGIQGEDAGSGVLCLWRKTIPALVRRPERRMPLRDDIGLA